MPHCCSETTGLDIVLHALCWVSASDTTEEAQQKEGGADRFRDVAAFFLFFATAVCFCGAAGAGTTGSNRAASWVCVGVGVGVGVGVLVPALVLVMAGEGLSKNSTDDFFILSALVVMGVIAVLLCSL